jgi:DNA-binding NtrC family response regulator
VLLVEPDGTALTILRNAGGFVADIEGCADFVSARARAVTGEFDFLITNLRLEAYNGLHLVYLAISARSTTRSIVYTERRESNLAREVQEAGAFYELRHRLPYALESYLLGRLPPADRRNPSVNDRRTVFRGGRRSADLPLFAAS